MPVGRNFLVVTYGYSQGEVGVDSYRDRYNVTNREPARCSGLLDTCPFWFNIVTP